MISTFLLASGRRAPKKAFIGFDNIKPVSLKADG
jgi:hypothetical protein